MAEDNGALGAQLRKTVLLSRQAVRLTWQAGPGLVFGIVALLVIQSALVPIELFFSKAIVDAAAFELGFQDDRPSLAGEWSLAVWIALSAAALMLGQLIQPVSSTFQSLIGDRLTHHVTERLIEATNRWQGLARFEDPAFADHMRRAQERAAWGGLHAILYGCEAVLALLTSIGLIVVLGRLHLLAPLLLVVAALPQLVCRWEYSRRTGSHIYAQTPESRRLEYFRDVLLAPDPAKDVRLYDLGPFFERRYDATFARTVASLDALRRRLTWRVALANGLAAGAAVAVYLVVVWRVADGRLSLGDLALYGGAATMLQARLLDLAFYVGYLPTPFQFLPSLFHVLDAPPDLPQPANPRPAPRPIRDGVVFERVAFAYPGGTTPVLRDVSFALRPRESLALVGHNGAGKTTIVKLLLRLYDPTAGRILLDGVDLREYDLDDLRARMAVIFQDFVRYELTAGENIGLGDLTALGDEERLLRAAAAGGAADVIRSLPNGLDTPLGRELGSRELSTGEWQKLALARAFVRDAAVLVLDEPTAALDVQTEHDVYTRFHELTRDRMTLLVSHRFSTVRMADRILFLRDGRVAEEGSHAELMALDGGYARLYRFQAARYERATEPEASHV
jgi:ATP-binding cassette subfamily B protein